MFGGNRGAGREQKAGERIKPMKPKYIILLIIAILSLIVLLQNTQVVMFRILFWKIEMSRVVMILLLLALGFISGFVVGRLNRGRAKNMV